jgi:hypothetical protein
LSTDFGVDLLDANLSLIETITEDCSGGSVSRDNKADVHGTCSLTISRELAWGRARVRPYQLLSSPSVGVRDVRFTLGTMLLTTPDRSLDEDPATYSCTGYDLLHLLQAPVGDSWYYSAGSFVLANVRAALTAAGITTPVLIDSSGAEKYLMKAKSWMLTSGESFTWLQVVNDLLDSIGYRGIYADQDGVFRCVPYVEPSERPSEWALNVGDLVTGIVGAERTATLDQWNVPNWFRVVRNQTVKPVEGNGRYTITNPSTGLSSIASLGRTVKAPVVFLDATSQADLVTQGKRLFAAATRVSEVISLKVSPFPAMGHADIYELNDPALGFPRSAVARSWEIPLGGEDCSLTIESV